MGNPADASLQAASGLTPSAGQTPLAGPSFSSGVSDSSTTLYAADHPALAEFSSLLGKFAGADVNLKASRNESPQTPAPQKSATGSASLGVGTLNSGLHNVAVDSTQILDAPKSENMVNTPAKGTIHPAPASGSVASEVAWQKGNEPEAPVVQDPLASSASAVPSRRLDTNSQPAPPANTLQIDAAPEANSIQPSGAAYANSSGSGAHANLPDSSTGGQGKSGQQSGTASGDSSASVIAFAPSIPNNPAGDPAANILTAHAPSVPASHGNTTAPQTLPSSSSQPTTTLSAWQNYDGGPGKIVRSASLSDSANGSEMRVELRTGALGPMEVHAVLRGGSLGAEIHVQGQEAHTLLASGLPSLERALGERNLRLENISVYQDHAGGGMSGGAKQDTQSGSSPSPQRQVSPWDNQPQARNRASSNLEDQESADPASGLSVRA